MIIIAYGFHAVTRNKRDFWKIDHDSAMRVIEIMLNSLSDNEVSELREILRSSPDRKITLVLKLKNNENGKECINLSYCT